MKAVDTNVIVRLLTEDDPVQTLAAKTLLTEPIFISDGVLMEAEWVLRSRYRWGRQRINEAFRQLIEVEAVTVADTEAVIWSLERHSAKADLADMLHIVASRRAVAFVTFESELAAEAGPDAPVPVELLT